MYARIALWIALALASAALLAPAALAQPQFVNGDFSQEVPRDGEGGGWVATGNDGAGGWQASIGKRGASFRINAAGASGSDPTIEQTVTGFTPGATYIVYGYYALGFAGGSPGSSFEMRVDGVTVGSLGPDPRHGSGGVNWAPFQFQFTATADTHVLQFASETNGSDHDYYIDEISFTRTVENQVASWSRVKAGF